MNFGWWNKVEDLARLEGVFRDRGFEPQMQHYLSEKSASDSVEPWRYKLDGDVYAYFADPSSGEPALRAILILKTRTGRLSVMLHGRDACPDRLLADDQEAEVEQLALMAGERFGRRVKVRYIESQRC